MNHVRLIAIAAGERRFGPVDGVHAMEQRHGALEATDAAEGLGRQTDFVTEQADEAARAELAPPTFVPVMISDETGVARPPAIEIELAGALVRVSPGVDPGLLAHVLRTLKGLR